MITVTVRSTDRVLGKISVEPEHGLVGRPWSEWEQVAIAGTLKITKGSKAATAALLQVGERSIYRKVEKYHLEHLCRESTNPKPFIKKENCHGRTM